MTTAESNAEWITHRYGKIQIVELEGLHVAAVPVHLGAAVGIGTSLQEALEDLKKDLCSDSVASGIRYMIRPEKVKKTTT